MDTVTKKRRRSLLKACKHCEQNFIVEDNFFPSNSPFFADGYLDICMDCIERMVNWRNLDEVDRLCRYADYAFLVEEYTRMMVTHEEKTVKEYCKLFYDKNYRGISWREINCKIIEKMARGQIELDIHVLKPGKLKEYQKAWGGGYSPDEYEWLENYYIDMHDSYEITTASHRDYLRKICKMSLMMDKELMQGGDIKKLADAFDKLMKSAEFTQASTKQNGTIGSISEWASVLEKHGFQPQFHDEVNRDVVDETLANVQEYLRTLVLGESSIQEMVEAAVEAVAKKNVIQNSSPTDITAIATPKHAKFEIDPLTEDLVMDDSNFELPDGDI